MTTLAACTSTVVGNPASPATTVAPTTTTTHRFDLCSLLDWPDLGYPGTENAVGPTKTGVVPRAKASCEWASQQFNAGYTPSPSPNCNNENDKDNVGAALSCVGDDAERLAEIENNSTYVIITVAYEAGRPKSRPNSYVDHGHTVYLLPDTDRCTGSTLWGGGILGVVDGDSSQAFGPPCDEVKKLIRLLIQREPH